MIFVHFSHNNMNLCFIKSNLTQAWAEIYTCRSKLVFTSGGCSLWPVWPPPPTTTQPGFTSTCIEKAPETHTCACSKPLFLQHNNKCLLVLCSDSDAGHFSVVCQIQAPAGSQCRHQGAQRGEYQLSEDHSWLSYTLPQKELNHR